MADKKLNELTTASDGAYVYAEDASGNQIKISKADLASVVAGVMKSNSLFPFMYKGYVGDANSLIETGIYRINASSTNTKTQYGVLTVEATEDYVVQRVVSAANLGMFHRIYRDGEWGSWQSLVAEEV